MIREGAVNITRRSRGQRDVKGGKAETGKKRKRKTIRRQGQKDRSETRRDRENQETTKQIK